MITDIKYNQSNLSYFNSVPKLLFICKASGEDNATPRMMHSHDDRLEIMFIYKGNGNYIIDGQFYSAKEGDILIFNANSIHDEQPLPSHDLIIYSCGISHLKLPKLPENHLIIKQQIPVLSAGHYSEQLKTFFEQLITYSEQGTPLSHELIHYSTLHFILLVHNIFQDQIKQVDLEKTNLGQKIKNLLDDNYAQGITINAISELLDINRYYLSHVFKDYIGLSPKQYIIRRKIGEAQSLLLSTDKSIEKISRLIGYQNIHNFYNIFEKVMGMSPVKYRKLWLKRYQER